MILSEKYLTTQAKLRASLSPLGWQVTDVGPTRLR